MDDILDNDLVLDEWAPNEDAPPDDKFAVKVPTLDEWHQVRISNMVRSRVTGVSKEMFFADVQLWETELEKLPSFSDAEIRKEVYNWNMEFDIANVYELSDLQEVYARMNSYRSRLTFLRDMVNQHYQTYTYIHKNMAVMAKGLFIAAKDVREKDANAENMVQPFAFPVPRLKRLLDFLDDIKNSLEFASMNVARVLKEKELALRISHTHHSEGQAHMYERLRSQPANSDVEIKTRDKSWYVAGEKQTKNA